MKYLAAQYQGHHELVLVEKEIPKLKDHDVLIRVASATICGTDFHILEGKFPAEPPVVIGHEFAGYVEQVGSRVTSVNPGDLVTIEPHEFCGLCKFCRIGKEHLCLKRKGYGVRLDGGFAEFCVIPEKTVYKVPSGISPSVAALTENIGCCLHGMERANVQFGDDVVVLGGGFVGVVLAELARMKGAGRVCIVEPNDYRREVAVQRGFLAINPMSDDVERTIKEMTQGLGADVVIEAAGRIDTAKLTLQLVGNGGTILFFGVVPPEFSMEISPNVIFSRELTLMGSLINPYSHHKSIEVLERLHLEPLVTGHFALKDIKEAFRTAQSGNGFKVAVHPGVDRSH
ncbi:alcohol dehydrogenase catalytic domain-containing protein [Paenibacillus hamazuiensis]|uniref:alcohol dehydrogenase catalytic domain-containing protein n=1 Tax=Paenibacillus hamazuiensis TaxID=2936508 RepID=UPI00200F9F6B|nr:alcohol dehydrogenase catalytic domain-containing protein [Paenibacillus hamazuiensis]